jgi:hypothetical protein
MTPPGDGLPLLVIERADVRSGSQYPPPPLVEPADADADADADVEADAALVTGLPLGLTTYHEAPKALTPWPWVSPGLVSSEK